MLIHLLVCGFQLLFQVSPLFLGVKVNCLVLRGHYSYRSFAPQRTLDHHDFSPGYEDAAVGVIGRRELLTT